jgi:PAS domain S-box-containing protein
LDGDPTASSAVIVAENVPAMVAYWDRHEHCMFANHAYQTWFGRTREQMLDTTLESLLGPLYALNAPHIREAMGGRTQTFERRIPVPDGTGVRESLATYTPDIRNGVVLGVYVHVADIGLQKQRERDFVRVVLAR